MNNMWILAQAESSGSSSGITSERVPSEQEETKPGVPADPNAPAGPGRRSPFGGAEQFIIIGIMLVMMYLILFRGPRKKQQQHKQMMQE
ncbi:MAG: hypothetical protein ACYTFQ_11315, partial [Planctomycetota bacterium]